MATAESMKFLEDIFQLMVQECLTKGSKQENKVVEFLPPEKLKDELDLIIFDKGTDYNALLDICKKIAHYSVKSNHPRHLSFFYSGFDAAGTAGAWLTDALNANIHNFEAAPVFIMIENFVIAELNKLVGFENGDGVFVPGSSFGNFLAIHLARFNLYKDVNKTGMFGLPRLCIFCSDEAHYSVMKAGPFLGFGSDSIIKIETFNGRMVPDALEQAIFKCKSLGQVPLIVIATCGTTVTGAFDPLEEIANICERHNVWLHADAAWGGAVLYSQHHRRLIKGIERSNSVVWSLHKLMGAPIQCAVILVKQKGQLQACNSSKASYLFATDKFYDVSYDIGDKTVQCGRKVDCLKFWMLWKSRGHSGMANHVDTSFRNSKYVVEKLRNNDGFRLIQDEFDYLNICFWYIPLRLRGKVESEQWWKEIGKVAPVVKEKTTKDGMVAISYQPLENRKLVNFLRIVTHPHTTQSDFEYIIEQIDKHGKHL